MEAFGGLVSSVLFTLLDEIGFVTLNLGIVLPVGTELFFKGGNLGNGELPSGVVKIGSNGLTLFIKSLVNIESYLTSIDGEGNSLLHKAAEKGLEKDVQDLLKMGMNIDGTNNAGNSPLHIAVKHSRENAKFFLKVGASGITTFASNVLIGDHVKVVKLLLEVRGNVTETDGDGNTPLLIAARTGHEKIVQLLLNAGANLNAIDKEGNTPLHIATREGHGNVVQFLLDEGADLTTTNAENNTPLHIAAREGHGNVVQLFLNAEADVNPVTNSGVTPLMYAGKHGHDNIVATLISRGAAINQRDQNGNTALMLASKAGKARVVKMLFQYKAKKQLRNNNGQTAKKIAKTSYRESIVKLFRYSKSVNFIYLKGGINLSKLNDINHSNSPGVDAGLSFVVKLSNRLRLQNDILFTLLASEIIDGNNYRNITGTDGSFYFELLHAEFTPQLRYNFGDIYEPNFFLVGGMGYRYMFEAKIMKSGEDSKVADITDSSDKITLVPKIGMGWGSPFRYFELTYRKGFPTQIYDVKSSFGSISLNFGLGF